MADQPPFCNHTWRSPRGDAPSSTDVNHVCALPAGHTSLPHLCPCRAYLEVNNG